MPEQPYAVFVGRRAQKAIARLPENVYRRVLAAVDALAEDPRPYPHSRELSGVEGRRLRVGNYRIFYEVDDEAREVVIRDVSHRQGAY